MNTHITEFDKLHAEYMAAKKNFTTKAQTFLHEYFKDFFKENPNVGYITWTQYTPYFNDGDTCEFGVYDFYFFDASVTNEISCPWNLRNFEYSEYDISKKYKDFESRLTSMAEASPEMFKDMFGDHVYVVATSDEFITEEYDHD